MKKKEFICPKCGKKQVPYEGAYCDKCKGTFDERCDRYRSAINSVEETGDWAEDMRRRRDAINSMFR